MDRPTDDWFLDEAFWAAAYPFMFPDVSFATAVEQVERILALAGFTGHDVLDLACGPGRHSVPLARRGFAVTGVDRSEFLLRKARAFALAEKVDVEWVRSDMRDFRRPDAYDLALSLFTSFGYFDSPEENERVLENVHASLRAGGIFVLDVAGKEVLAHVFEATGSKEVPGAGMVVQRRHVVDDWSRMDNDWILIRGGTARVFRLRHWIYSGQELKGMLRRAGFSEVQLYGDLRGGAYGPDATRLVAFARKDRRSG